MMHHNHRTHFQQIIENDDAAQRICVYAAAGVVDNDSVAGLQAKIFAGIDAAIEAGDYDDAGVGRGFGEEVGEGWSGFVCLGECCVAGEEVGDSRVLGGFLGHYEVADRRLRWE